MPDLMKENLKHFQVQIGFNQEQNVQNQTDNKQIADNACNKRTADCFVFKSKARAHTVTFTKRIRRH